MQYSRIYAAHPSPVLVYHFRNGNSLQNAFGTVTYMRHEIQLTQLPKYAYQ